MSGSLRRYPSWIGAALLAISAGWNFVAQAKTDVASVLVGRPPSTLALSVSKGERSGQAFRAADRGPDQPPPRLRRSAVASAKAESLALRF